VSNFLITVEFIWPFIISKIIERIVKHRLMYHLFSLNRLNPRQSAYQQHYSTETSLLYIHDHLITAIGSQKLYCLCLLDLSAAFDTTDHDIILTRQSSWFSIHGSIINWFKSYLLSRTFCDKCDNHFSSLHGPMHCSLCFALHNVYNSSQYSNFIFVTMSPPVCWRYTTFSLISSLRLPSKHYSPPECSHTDYFQDDF